MYMGLAGLHEILPCRWNQSEFVRRRLCQQSTVEHLNARHGVKRRFGRQPAFFVIFSNPTPTDGFGVALACRRAQSSFIR